MEQILQNFMSDGNKEELVGYISELVESDEYFTAYVLVQIIYDVTKVTDEEYNQKFDEEFLDDVSLVLNHVGKTAESFDLLNYLLRKKTSNEDRTRYHRNRVQLIEKIKNRYTEYPYDIVSALTRKKAYDELHSSTKKITLTITTCKRLVLFEKTMNSFLQACADVELIDEFLCVDDQSSSEDRLRMTALYPFFKFHFKTPEEKGHQKSMNIIRLKVTTPYIFHMEDDFLFFEKRNYITECMEILDENPKYGQVLLNKNYAEVPEDETRIFSGEVQFSRASGCPYLKHVHYDRESEEYRNHFKTLPGGVFTCAYWPGFSFRPALHRFHVWRELGDFNVNNSYFEIEYAYKYRDAGYTSCFLDSVVCLHTGRLTSEINSNNRSLNAYELNNEEQMGRQGQKQKTQEEPIMEVIQEQTVQQQQQIVPTNNNVVRVKISTFWTNSKAICDLWEKMSKGNGRWGNIQLTWEDEPEPDYYVVINKPYPGEHIIPNKTIYFPMEPYIERRSQLWGEWSTVNERKNDFFHVHSFDEHPEVAEWHLSKSFTWLRSNRIEKKKGNTVSAIVSSKYEDPGQRKRVNFLRFLDHKNISLDIYGSDNKFRYRNYRGSLPPHAKENGLFPYKYTFNAENNAIKNYATEKIYDAVLSECLCFYWGCPNIADIIDPGAYVVLDLSNHEECFQKIKSCIQADVWGSSIQTIRREKMRILHNLNFFPTLERIICQKRNTVNVGNKSRLTVVPGRPENIQGSVDIFVETNAQGNKTITFKNLNVCQGQLPDEIARNLHKVQRAAEEGPSGQISEPEPQEATNPNHVISHQINLLNQELDDVKLSGIDTVIETGMKNDSFTEYLTNTFSKVYIVDFLQQRVKHYRSLEKLRRDNIKIIFGNPQAVIKQRLPKQLPIKPYIFHINSSFERFNDEQGDAQAAIEAFPRSIIITHDESLTCENYERLRFAKPIVSFYHLHRDLIQYYLSFFKMKGFVVNLDRRPDRYETFQQNTRNLLIPMERFSAIDGKELVRTEEITRIFNGNDFGWRASVIGAALSHFKLWKMLANDEDHDFYLVLEDDVELCPDFNIKFLKCMSWLGGDTSWALMYGGHHLRSVFDGVHSNASEAFPHDTPLRLWKVNDFSSAIKESISGAFCYLISKRGAKALVEYVNRHGITHGVDYEMMLSIDKLLEAVLDVDWAENYQGADTCIFDYIYLKESVLYWKCIQCLMQPKFLDFTSGMCCEVESQMANEIPHMKVLASCIQILEERAGSLIPFMLDYILIDNPIDNDYISIYLTEENIEKARLTYHMSYSQKIITCPILTDT